MGKLVSEWESEWYVKSKEVYKMRRERGGGGSCKEVMLQVYLATCESIYIHVYIFVSLTHFYFAFIFQVYTFNITNDVTVFAPPLHNFSESIFFATFSDSFFLMFTEK